MEISKRTLKHAVLIVFVVAALTVQPVPTVQAGQINLVGPAGSGRFGHSATVLPNGNIVVTDPYYDAGGTADIGAVHLYNGASGALISTLTGSSTQDYVGFDGVTVLSNGNYVIRSRYWDRGGIADAGAVTWCDGATGIDGSISATNSLVGSTSKDYVGTSVTALANGNYVVVSRFWNSGGVKKVGAATWGDGTTGISGSISAANSLVGSSGDDGIGSDGVFTLSNGNYVVVSRYWDNGRVINTGAVTWGDGMTGVVGAVSSTNSLVGSSTQDYVGADGVIELNNNGNYVVTSLAWDSGDEEDVGAVTWGDGTAGVTGIVSVTNSLVGSSAYDEVGYGGVTALNNGNYVVSSQYWDNGEVTDAGAATWGNGTTGVTGVVSVTNSLVGSSDRDWVGRKVTALTNGNYVVSSLYWDNGSSEIDGSVTWGDGTTGIAGVVSTTNSLTGSSGYGAVGAGVTALTNGHYVVVSPRWGTDEAYEGGAVTWVNGTMPFAGVVSTTNSLVGGTDHAWVGNCGATALPNGNYVVLSANWTDGVADDVGAVTWVDGTGPITGVVSTANSLVGSKGSDYVGLGGVTVLSNGNYVVISSWWSSNEVWHAGAVTWGDGTTGVSGVVSAANSLVGDKADDVVGSDGVTALSNGHYVVNSPFWNGSEEEQVGAVTWGDGTSGLTGVVSTTNSLVGGTYEDKVGNGGVTALSNGDYVVWSSNWHNAGVSLAGAATWGKGALGTRGLVKATNSVYGTVTSGSLFMVWAYDDTNTQLVVGRPMENTVTLLRRDTPVANAGSDQIVSRGETVTLDGSASNDPDEDLPLSYNWVQTGGPCVSFGPTISVTNFTAPSYPTVLTFSLIVTDSLGLVSDADEVVITVPNQAPIADAGSDHEVYWGAMVALDGTDSNDPDGDVPLVYGWTQTSGPSVSFSPALSMTTFIAPNSSTVLSFTLIVTDSLGMPSISDEVTVMVVSEYNIYIPLIQME